MYKPKIFLTESGEEGLTVLEETGYVAESVLQRLLVDYPDLLAGDQIDPENPRRWLLVCREMGVPDDIDAGGRWSLDHLFLDQDGIPTFVECKRADDTRVRREVVAQMLDYAANGIEYWSMDRLRQSAAEMAQTREASLDEEIEALLDTPEADTEEYWERVERNLHDHRVRLVFVADRTPKELRRLVEFLNEEMANVEVLAVEIKQYQRTDQEEQKALVPRVIGMTESARAAKQRPTSRKSPLTPQEYLEQCPPRLRDFYTRALDRAKERGHHIHWTPTGFSIRAHAPAGSLTTFLYGRPDRLSFFFGAYFRQPKQASEGLRENLMRLGVFDPGGQYTLRAYFEKHDLEQMRSAYGAVLDEVDDFIRRKQQGD